VTDVEAVRYREAGRSYLTTAILGGVLLLGFVLDLVVGAGVHHIVGWAIAMVLIVGSEALTVYAARVMRTVTITDEQISVGEENVPRSTITSVKQGVDVEDRVLGRKYATGLPRGTVGVCLELADGSRAVLATRHPNRVLDVLGAEPAEEPAQIRIADEDEHAVIAEIGDRADSLFRVAGYELPDFERSPEHPPIKRILVLGRPAIGFVELAEVDGEGYVAELAVLPSHMRRGYGTALMNAACDWAREQGYPALTLTTFTEIAWNGPFYGNLGFSEVEPTGGLAKIRAHEAEVGLDAVSPRVAMRREL